MLSWSKQIEARECQHQLNTLLTLSPFLRIRQTFLRKVSFISHRKKLEKVLGLKNSRIRLTFLPNSLRFKGENSPGDLHLLSTRTKINNSDYDCWVDLEGYQLLLKHVIKERGFDHWIVVYWLQTRDIFIRIPPLITWHRGTQFSEYRGILTDKRQLFLQKNISDLFKTKSPLLHFLL